jgi:hypothetical protein
LIGCGLGAGGEILADSLGDVVEAFRNSPRQFGLLVREDIADALQPSEQLHLGAEEGVDLLVRAILPFGLFLRLTPQRLVLPDAHDDGRQQQKQKGAGGTRRVEQGDGEIAKEEENRIHDRLYSPILGERT